MCSHARASEMRPAETWVRPSDRSRGRQSVVSAGWWTDHPSAAQGGGLRRSRPSEGCAVGGWPDKRRVGTGGGRAGRSLRPGLGHGHRAQAWTPCLSFHPLGGQPPRGSMRWWQAVERGNRPRRAPAKRPPIPAPHTAARIALSDHRAACDANDLNACRSRAWPRSSRGAASGVTDETFGSPVSGAATRARSRRSALAILPVGVIGKAGNASHLERRRSNGESGAIGGS